MKNGILSARLGADYQLMVERLRIPGESDSDFVRRAIDSMALMDEEFLGTLGEEDYGV